MLFRSTLNKLINAETVIGNNAYKMTDLFTDLKKGIWSELSTKKPIDVYRRNLQKSYVSILDNLLNPSATTTVTLGGGGFGAPASVNTDKSDIKSVVRAHLTALKNEVTAAATTATDPMTKYHLRDVTKRIDKALNPKD